MPDPAVWYCIPSARADGGTLRLWKDRGYSIAVQRDPDAPRLSFGADYYWEHEWDGYPKAVNRLCREVLKEFPETLVCVTGGDDVEPDPTHDPRVIQGDFADHFKGTYGIFQPTGDEWSDSQGRIIERIAGSPWMGRDWILKSMGGNGPIFEGFNHYYEDEHLQEAAKMQGVFWQRSDIVQKHNHWTLDRSKGKPQRPAYLEKAQAMWDHDKRVFEQCKANGFKESMPL